MSTVRWSLQQNPESFDISGVHFVASNIVPENSWMMSSRGEVVAMGMVGEHGWSTTDSDLIRRAQRLTAFEFDTRVLMRDPPGLRRRLGMSQDYIEHWRLEGPR